MEVRTSRLLVNVLPNGRFLAGYDFISEAT